MDTKYRESNKLIAEFMGLKLPLTVRDYSATISIGSGYYHKSWDWLMPVVKKIIANEFPQKISNYLIYVDIQRALINADIEGVYDSVVNYIKQSNK